MAPLLLLPALFFSQGVQAWVLSQLHEQRKHVCTNLSWAFFAGEGYEGNPQHFIREGSLLPAYPRICDAWTILCEGSIFFVYPSTTTYGVETFSYTVAKYLPDKLRTASAPNDVSIIENSRWFSHATNLNDFCTWMLVHFKM